MRENKRSFLSDILYISYLILISVFIYAFFNLQSEQINNFSKILIPFSWIVSISNIFTVLSMKLMLDKAINDRNNFFIESSDKLENVIKLVVEYYSKNYNINRWWFILYDNLIVFLQFITLIICVIKKDYWLSIPLLVNLFFVFKLFNVIKEYRNFLDNK